MSSYSQKPELRPFTMTAPINIVQQQAPDTIKLTSSTDMLSTQIKIYTKWTKHTHQLYNNTYHNIWKTCGHSGMY